MNYKRAVKESLRFWPESIDISNGEVTEEVGFFPLLSIHWQLAEEYAKNRSDWHQLAVWAIYCAMHRKACDEFRKGNLCIAKSTIDPDYIRQKFAESLLRQNTLPYPRLMRRAFLRHHGRSAPRPAADVTEACVPCKLW